MMTDDKFLEKAASFFIMEDTAGKAYTLEEYKSTVEATQKDKEGKYVILYTTQPVQQDSYITRAVEKGFVVAKMETLVDAAFINQMEMKWPDVRFTRVDADIAENLINADDNLESVLTGEETDTVKKLFDQTREGVHLQVEVKGLNPEALPVMATRPEFMRRMKDMASVGGGMASFYAGMPDEVQLTVNGNHPLVKSLLAESDPERQQQLVSNLSDLALLSQGLLSGNQLTQFIERSVGMMGKS
jgi:molecular chaperone HtpG